jgi:hypothetical protein
MGGSTGRVAVLVDDAEVITDSPIANDLDRLMRAARDAGHIVVIAGNTDEMGIGFRGFLVDARRARSASCYTRVARSTVRYSASGYRAVLAAPRPRAVASSSSEGRSRNYRSAPAPPRRRGRPGQPQTVTERVPIAAPPCVTVTLTAPSWAPLK